MDPRPVKGVSRNFRQGWDLDVWMKVGDKVAASVDDVVMPIRGSGVESCQGRIVWRPSLWTSDSRRR
jgi:hypothetical protein